MIHVDDAAPSRPVRRGEPPVIELFVPGRLCLMGEHSDWAGGYRRTHPALAPGHCLVAGTDQGIRVRAEPRIHEVAISHWLDEERRWYRYHHLFAEVLRARLGPTHSDQVRELHRRASDRNRAPLELDYYQRLLDRF